MDMRISCIHDCVFVCLTYNQNILNNMFFHEYYIFLHLLDGL